MFDMIAVAAICARANREEQDLICKLFTLPDNPRRTSEQLWIFLLREKTPFRTSMTAWALVYQQCIEQVL